MLRLDKTVWTLKKIGQLTLLTCFLSSCSSTTRGGRSQLLMVSPAQMSQNSAAAYSQLRAEAANKNALYPETAPISKRVNTIAQRLIAQVGVFRPDATKWPWSVSVIRDNQVNAMCLPDGRIVVFDAIINKLSLTDEELAAILGHEISHALREHSREKVSQNTLQGLAISIGGAAAGLSGSSMQQLGQLGQLGIALPFSRAMETESDIMGLELMARAGYNPQAAPNVWKKMSALNGASTPAVLSTHPSNNERIANLTANIPRVMPLYEATLIKNPQPNKK
ncbi:MAG: M48 family metallopeptidase [Neisseriaceae bacterium]|nr:M48 family metallopeptidase [Neisseriaceae bacterium]